jgi:hypothetical protein
MSSNTVTFKVAGNDILTFMDQIRKKNDQLTSDMLNAAKQQSSSAKEQMKSLQEQIKAMERLNSLKVESSRLLLAQNKANSLGKNRQDFEQTTQLIQSDPTLKDWQKKKSMAGAQSEFEGANAATETIFKDQLTALRETERQSILQVKGIKDVVDTIKMSAAQQLRDASKNSEALGTELKDTALTDQEKLAKQLALEEKKKQEEDQENRNYKDEKGGGMSAGTMGMVAAQYIEQAMGSFSRLTQSENGFDMIRNSEASKGRMLGALVGGTAGFLSPIPGGAIVGAAVGSAVGGAIGDASGGFDERRAKAMQELLEMKNKYRATTGSDVNSWGDHSDMGVSSTDFLQSLREIAINTGTSARAAKTTEEVLQMEKGQGIEKNTSTAMMQYFRGTNKDIANLVQGVMDKGSKGGIFKNGDFTFLNEFMQKFNSLHNELRATSEKVATGTTFDTMNMFNKVGGQFSMQDPRSMGLISTIQQALVNPGSDSTQAMSFLALRKSNPNLGIAGMIEERQKGFGSPAYMKSMMEYALARGGTKDMQIANIAGTFGLGGNYAAARKLLENKGKILSSHISKDEIEELTKGTDFKSKAEANTTPIEKNMALIKDGLLDTWTNAVQQMIKVYEDAMLVAANGMTVTTDKNGKKTFNAIKVNAVPNNLQNTTEAMMPVMSQIFH